MVFTKLNCMLDSYNERDKILRLLSYTSNLVSAFTNNTKLSKLAGLLSECRVTLRLLDDIPMLTYTLSYGLGKKEPDLFLQVCGVIINVLDQLYYPCEHVAWAADKGLLSVRSDPWWTASNVCWAFSLYFSLVRSLRYLSLLHEHSRHLDLTGALMRSVNSKEEFKKNSRLQLAELLSGVRCVCDLIHAVHWLPEGFLWAGRLQPWHIAALGTVSSVLSLVHSCTFKHS